MKNVVIIPIEVYAREIEHKLLLAYYLASFRGYTVLLASDTLALQTALNLGEHAIYVGKNLFLQPDALPPGTQLTSKVDNTDLLRLLSRSVKIVFVDEEGGLFLDGSFSKHDCQSFMARLPLNPDQYSHKIHNLAFCHWGPYQSEIASQYCPNIVNISVGPPCVDAARAFSALSDCDPASNLSSPRISVLGTTTVLTQGAFQQSCTYLAVDWFFKQYDSNYTAQALLAEVGAASAAHHLSKLGYRVEYRAHPGSGGLVLDQWYKHCRSQGIHISFPHREPILSFLSKSHLSLHTAGCTTSLLSYFLKRYSLRVGPAQCGTASNLLQEPFIDSIDEITYFINDPKFPSLSTAASRLIERPSAAGLVSFENIANVIERFNSNISSSLSLTSFVRNLELTSFPFVASRNLRHLRWWKMPKFSTFYQADIRQCFRVGQLVWPLSPPPRLVSKSSQYLVISP